MKIEQKKYRRTILSAPTSLLDSNTGEDKIATVNTLHESYLSQRKRHKQLQLEVKNISREIGAAKLEQRPFDTLINKMKTKGQQLSGVSDDLKQAEQQLLSFFKLQTVTQQHDPTDDTSIETLAAPARSKKGATTSTDPAISIEFLDRDEAGWNQYVDTNTAASIYHRMEWRDIIKNNFGHESHYLLAKDHNAHIVGILPLVRLKSAIFGDFLISMPYFNYGGAIADHADIEERLVESANKLGASLAVEHIEYRDDISRAGMPSRSNKVNMILALPSSPSELWQRIGSKLRAQIKRPQRENPTIKIGGIELIDDFYAVFARNMRDLGTPVYGKSFFENILQGFPEQSKIIIVRLKNRPVSAGFLLGYKDTLEIPWASTIRDVNHLSMNMLM